MNEAVGRRLGVSRGSPEGAPSPTHSSSRTRSCSRTRCAATRSSARNDFTRPCLVVMTAALGKWLASCRHQASVIKQVASCRRDAHHGTHYHT